MGSKTREPSTSASHKNAHHRPSLLILEAIHGQ